MKRDTWLDETDAALADAAQRYVGERYAFGERQRLPAGLRVGIAASSTRLPAG